jgi:hypothetical protein
VAKTKLITFVQSRWCNWWEDATADIGTDYLPEIFAAVKGYTMGRIAAKIDALEKEFREL